MIAIEPVAPRSLKAVGFCCFLRISQLQNRLQSNGVNPFIETVPVATPAFDFLLHPSLETVSSCYTESLCSFLQLISLILQQGWGLGKGRRWSPFPQQPCRRFIVLSRKESHCRTSRCCDAITLLLELLRRAVAER